VVLAPRGALPALGAKLLNPCLSWSAASGGGGVALPCAFRGAFTLASTQGRPQLPLTGFWRGLSSITAPPGAGGLAVGDAEAGSGARERVVEKAQAQTDMAKVQEVHGEEKAGARAMGWWLIGCSGMVAGMVVLGGVTRLTGSGLSMVKWHPHRILPPADQAAWEKEFEEFKTYPEWIMKRQYENFGKNSQKYSV
jgi:hypothetical protein